MADDDAVRGHPKIMPTHWKRPLTIPPLYEEAVQLWRLEMGTPGAEQVLANAAAVLHPVEQERADRTIAFAARAEFLSGRTLLRMLLGDLLGVPPGDVQLAATETGKPYLAGNSMIRFNVSHSDGLVLIALACGVPVGVDVESRQAGSVGPEELLELASFHFSVQEHRGLAALPPGQERTDAFLEIWTRREAVSKADGGGIASPFTLRAMGAEEGVQAERKFGLRRAGLPGERIYYVRSVGVGVSHHAALALERPGLRLFCLRAEGLFG